MTKSTTYPYFFAFSLFGLMLINYSCKPEELEQRNNFDRNQMLQDMADHHVEADIVAFQDACEELHTAIEAFQATPDLNNLDLVQNQWISTAISWENCAPYNFGEIMNSYVFNKIEYRPANFEFIEDYIQDTVSIHNTFIESIGSSSKGLPAMEYLLFDANDDDNTILDSLTTNSRRMNYLVSLSENLNDKATQLEAVWMDYYPTFINYEGNNVGGSVSELMNEMSSVLETAYAQRLGFPLGKNDFTNSGQPEDVEAPLSHSSLSFIKSNVEAVENVFFNDGTNLLGFDDYLDALGATYNNESLSTALRTQFDKVESALNAIPGTLDNAVINHYNLVETAYFELKELVVLLKVDVASQLSITITFNDNDGD